MMGENVLLWALKLVLGAMILMPFVGGVGCTWINHWYNAMTDEASVGGQNDFAREGSDPLIIFDGSSSLLKRSTNKISSDEERKALMKFNKWQGKARSKRGEWNDQSPSLNL